MWLNFHLPGCFKNPDILEEFVGQNLWSTNLKLKSRTTVVESYFSFCCPILYKKRKLSNNSFVRQSIFFSGLFKKLGLLQIVDFFSRPEFKLSFFRADESSTQVFVYYKQFYFN